MKKWLLPLLSAVAGGVLTYSIMSMGAGEVLKSYPKSYTWIFLGSAPIVYLFVVGFHELGHVAFGKWQNFDFRALTVGPFGWSTDDEGNIRFKWNKNLNLAGGIAFMLPSGEERLRERFRWFAAGGPIASVVLTAAAIGLAYPLPDGSLLEYFVGGTGVLSALIFLVTIAPFRAGAMVSDGMRILTFSRDTPRAKADLLQIQLLAYAQTGKPYREIPIDRIEETLQLPGLEKAQMAIVRYFGYIYYLANEHIDRAEESLGEVMQDIEAFPPGMRENFYLEEATFRAAYRKDLAGAEAAYANYKSTPTSQEIDDQFYRAAVAVLKDDKGAYRAAADRVRELAPSALDQSSAQMKLSQLDDWDRQWESGPKE